MLTRSEYRSLIEVDTPEDMLSLLKSTVYGRSVSKLKDYSIVEVERALREYQRKEHLRIIHGVDGPAKTLLERYYSRHEVELIKEALVLKQMGMGKEELGGLYPTKRISREILERMGEFKGLKESIEVLKGTGYYESLTRAFPGYQESGYLYYLTFALDSELYRKLWKSVAGLVGIDKNNARELVGSEIDVRNIMAALRLRGYEGNVKEFLIPVRFHVSDAIFESLSRVRSISQLSSEVPRFTYWETIEQAVKNSDEIMRELPLQKPGERESFLPIEHELEKFLVKKNNSMFFGNRLHVGVPLAHLYLKGIEVRNIVSALKLKEARVENEKIENFLLLPS